MERLSIRPLASSLGIVNPLCSFRVVTGIVGGNGRYGKGACNYVTEKAMLKI